MADHSYELALCELTCFRRERRDQHLEKHPADRWEITPQLRSADVNLQYLPLMAPSLFIS